MRLISAESLVQIQSPPPVKAYSGLDIDLLCLIFFLLGSDDEPPLWHPILLKSQFPRSDDDKGLWMTFQFCRNKNWNSVDGPFQTR